MPNVVRALLEKGADPNARTFKTMPLLSRYIQQQTGLDITPNGATPFWWAASYGDLAAMHMLIEWGADPWINTSDGTTPLMVAAGVDFVEGQDKYGRRWFALDTTVLQQRAKAAVQYCLDLGLDINAANNKGQTALHGAVYFGGTMWLHHGQHSANMNAATSAAGRPADHAGRISAGSFIAHTETGEVLARLGADTKLGKDLGGAYAEKAAVQR
jgi:ankyrin repeat protein